MKASLPDVIERGRRRLLRNAIAVASARAACAGLGSFVLLLVLGADIVDWRWLTIFPTLTFAAGALLAWRRCPNGYKTAQHIDARLHLADTLSTAVFYWPAHLSVRCDEKMRCSQREYAGRMASAVNLRAAFPLQIPRPVLSCLTALMLLAVGLGIVRHHLEHSLDLRRPLAPCVQEWARSFESMFSRAERYRLASTQDKNDALGEKADGRPQESSGDDSSSSASEDRDTADPGEALAQKGEKPASGSGSEGQENQTADRRQQDSEEPAGSGDEAGSQPRDAQSSNGADNQPGTSSGLLGKLSNSLANLTSALKSKLAGAADRKGIQGAGHGTSSEIAKAANANAGAQGDTPEAKAGDAGAAGDSSPTDSGGDAMSGRSANPEQRGGNGAGSDDGSKQLQLAKQLEAMGKISVILGKRSQGVSGDVSVEVTSGRSELRTPYELRHAAHGSVEASAERDRIPIEFESYVQQYFRELRQARRRSAEKK